jgi:hypothetical protein
MTFTGTFGVHLLPHHPGWQHLPTHELLAIGEAAARSEAECIWFATRFLSRDSLTLMAMMASRFESSFGTLVANPWGRNPNELVGTLGVIAEMLAPGRELRFGIGSGVTHRRWVDRPQPLRVVRETIEMLRSLLAGETVAPDRFTVVPEYFHMHGEAALGVQLTRPEAVSFWFAVTGGPLGDRLAAEVADGFLLDAGTVMGLDSLSDGRADDYVARLDRSRAERSDRPLRRILNLCMSVADDRDAAYAVARQHATVAAGRGVGLHSGRSTELSDSDLRASFLVGTPDEVSETLSECFEHATRLGCEHIVLGVPTGPDPARAVELASSVVIPLARARAG